MADLTEREQAALAGLQHYQDWDSGYSKQQSHPAPDARLRPRRLAGRPGGVDPREVLGLDRLRRPSRERAHPRRAARQRDALLAHRHRRLVGPPLLGELRHASAATPSTSRPACRSSPRRSSAPSRSLGRAALHATSATGTSSTRAATSPPSSSPSCSSTRSGASSGRCADLLRSACRDRRSPVPHRFRTGRPARRAPRIALLSGDPGRSELIATRAPRRQPGRWPATAGSTASSPGCRAARRWCAPRAAWARRR